MFKEVETTPGGEWGVVAVGEEEPQIHSFSHSCSKGRRVPAYWLPGIGLASIPKTEEHLCPSEAVILAGGDDNK